MTALERLELPNERRESVVPLLEKKLRDGTSPAAQSIGEAGIDRYAKKLIRVDAASGKSFAEYSAFDLSMDDAATATIAAVRDAMTTTDIPIVQLGCLASLVRIVPNPTVVEGLLTRTYFRGGADAMARTGLGDADLGELGRRLRAQAEELDRHGRPVDATVDDLVS